MAKKRVTPESHYAKLKRLAELQRNYACFFYKPYEKQRQFHAEGALHRERLLMAGNKLGKTFAAGFEVAYHLTGLYPDWWTGRRFTKSNRGWAGSVTSELTRDGIQRILLGPIGKWGSGCIPKDCIVEIKRARGVPDAIESVLVKHTDGEVSQVIFKAYSDGREAWQAEDLEWVWFDEEPPFDIYIEGLTRTNNSGGPVFMTFTPLMGMSSVVMRFLEENHRDRSITNMTIDDVEHYSPELKRQILEGYPEHEREARAMGIPMLGEGRIFQISEEIIKEPTLIQIPPHWKQIIGLDFGWDHPTAAVRLAYDEENDVIHIVSEYRQKKQIPLIHAAAIKQWGIWIPVAWPHDGYQHDKGSGDQVANIYAKEGLRMLSEHAQFSDERGYGVIAGLEEMRQRMQTQRLRVDANLSQWWEEYRSYHMKKGQIVKERDDLLCATRYAIMCLRYAIPQQYAPPPRDKYNKHYPGETGRTWMSS